MAAIAIPLTFILPVVLLRPGGLPAIESANSEKSDAVSLAADKLVTASIASSAILEGAAFLNLAAVYIAHAASSTSRWLWPSPC